MLKLSFLLVGLVGLVSVLADNEALPQRLIYQRGKGVGGPNPNPYIYITIPKGRAQHFEVIGENDEQKSFNEYINKREENEIDENENNDEDEDEDESWPAYNNKINDDDDDDDEQQLDEEEQDEVEEAKTAAIDYSGSAINANLNYRKSGSQIKNENPTKTMATSPPAGAIVIPHDMIKIEGQNFIDEQTGESTLLLPRSILDDIPYGSVVAIMKKPFQKDEAEGRATRVIVRRHRKGNRNNLIRFGNDNRRYRVIKQRANKRRNNLRRQKVIIVRRRKSQNGNKSDIKRRRIYLQG